MMDSPFCDGKASLKERTAIVPFRKENFRITRKVYVCDKTGIEFSTEEQDYEALETVHNLYRKKHCIPSPEEIQEIRLNYNISTTKMSLILGMGINQYHNYENGEIPSLSNARLIMAAKNKNMFLCFLEAAKQSLTEKDYKKIKSSITNHRQPEAAEPTPQYPDFSEGVADGEVEGGVAMPAGMD